MLRCWRAHDYHFAVADHAARYVFVVPDGEKQFSLAKTSVYGPNHSAWAITTNVRSSGSLFAVGINIAGMMPTVARRSSVMILGRSAVHASSRVAARFLLDGRGGFAGITAPR